MDTSLAYGRLVLSEQDQHGQAELGRHALAAPINDLIGLRPDPEYVTHLQRYGPFWPPLSGFDEDGKINRPATGLWWEPEGRTEIERTIDAWIRDKLPELFHRAANSAAQGQLSGELSPMLERVTFRPGKRPDSVPDGDLPVLAAWCLDQTLRRAEIEIRNCESCRVPFITSSGSAFCDRPAPGHTRSCRDIQKEARFLETQGDYRRLYKTLHERKRRGKLPKQVFNLWVQDNQPGEAGKDWQPLYEWLDTRTPKALEADLVMQEWLIDQGLPIPTHDWSAEAKIEKASARNRSA